MTRYDITTVETNGFSSLQCKQSTSGVKSGSWYTKNITINGKCLNKGSFIDYLNAANNQLPNSKPIKKGWWIFGWRDETKSTNLISRAIDLLKPINFC